MVWSNLFKPVCLKNQLKIVAPEDLSAEKDRGKMIWNCLSRVCLWTKRKKALADILANNEPVPGVIGNFYNLQRGFDPMIRNLLANPQINTVVIRGRKMVAVVDLLIKAADNWFEMNEREFRDLYGIGDDIPAMAIEEVLDRVLFTESIAFSALESREQESFACTDEPKVFVAPEKVPTFKSPGPSCGALVRGKTIQETWIRLLDHIQRYGLVSDTHYDRRQKEVFGLVAIVEDQPVRGWNGGMPDFLGAGEVWPCWMPMDDIETYTTRLWNGEKPDGASYTYGNRMRNGVSPFDAPDGAEDGIDQLKGAIHKLMQNPDQRSACVSLWYGSDATTKSGTPCLMVVNFRVAHGKLHMIVYIRSNDMFSAWPSNVAGFRGLQAMVLREIRRCATIEQEEFWDKVKLGSTITVSGSAHYYEDCWDAVDRVLADHLKEETGLKAQPEDPYGNWLIVVVETPQRINNHIKATLLDPITGESAQVFTGCTAMAVYQQMAPFVHTSSHALDLGAELMKAELCIKQQRVYDQDKPLNALLRSET